MPEAGWYDDPHRPGTQRYWDGVRWTDQTYAPVGTAGAAPTAVTPAPAPVGPAPAPVPPAETSSRGVPTALILVLALVAGLIAAGVTFLVVSGDGDDDVTASAEREEAAAPRRSSPGAGNDDAGAGGAPSSSTTSRPTTSTSAPSPTAAAPVGTWIAVLASTPVGEGRPAADARLAELRSVASDAQLVLSDDFASLNPGYYVTYVGGFSSEDAVISFCGSRSLAVPDQCYARFLSNDPADRSLGG